MRFLQTTAESIAETVFPSTVRVFRNGFCAERRILMSD
jgi:hypothetical protein